MTAVIRLDGITKIYGPDPSTALGLVRQGRSRAELLAETDHVLALDRVDLEVPAGAVFVVMGLSGSGKSTLVRCINRLVEPTSGRILVDGTDLTALPRADLLQIRSDKLGMVFQHFALLPHRTVLDNVAFGLEVRGVPRAVRHARAREVLKQVGLEGWEKRLPAELSGGMQQRVGLARALALDPPILLMDEPFSGLDPLIRKEMQRELLDIQARLHKTIVFITHDLDEAVTLGDRIAILRDGRIEQQGSPQEIVLAPASELVGAFVRDVNALKVLTAESAMESAAGSGRDAYRLGDPLPAADAARQAVLVVDRDGRYLGLTTGPELGEMVAAGAETLRASPGGGPAAVRCRAPLGAALEAVARPPFLVPVTDAEQRLVGVLTRESVFATLRRAGRGAGGGAA
jgi:glycine betaine/proline transport system ATP-binding protein